MRRKASITIAVVALTVVIGLLVANRVRSLHAPGRVTFVTETGRRLPSFFAGLPVVPAYVGGKMYPKTKRSDR